MGSGLVLHTGAQWLRKYGLLKTPLTRNTLMLSVLGGGAFGSFLCSVVTGKQEVHNLHPIFQAGANPKGNLDYQRALRRAREREEDVHALEQSGLADEERSHHDVFDGELDRQKLEQIRVIRRKTVHESFRTGHGLNDSHGGHWAPHDKNES